MLQPSFAARPATWSVCRRTVTSLCCLSSTWPTQRFALHIWPAMCCVRLEMCKALLQGPHF